MTPNALIPNDDGSHASMNVVEEPAFEVGGQFVVILAETCLMIRR